MKKIRRNLYKLLEISSEALCQWMPTGLEGQGNLLIDQLFTILSKKNGFIAFERALHFFPSGAMCGAYSLEEWNRFDRWKKEYGDRATDLLCFAEDVFGYQFAIRADKICRFDPETGNSEDIASDMEEWAGLILNNYEVETGYPLAHEWQKRFGQLRIGQQLIPKIPFVLGGEFDISNLYAVEAVRGMHIRANLARQIKDLPDGSKIKFEITE